MIADRYIPIYVISTLEVKKMETTEEIRKCPSCGQRMRKTGKIVRSGYAKQRWQCTNRSCPKYGVMQLEGF